MQAPATPLDSLRHLLSEFSPTDADFDRRLSQKLGELRKGALSVVADFLKRPGASALRKAALPAIQKHDWPEWSWVLFDVLSKEPELNVFDEGCAALASLGTKASWKALQRLATVRTDRDRQIILRRELNELEVKQPLAYYLGRVLEGEGNPRLAAGGARMVAVAATPQDVPAIVEAYQAADQQAKRLLLRLLPCVHCQETENFLAYVLKQAAVDLLDSRSLLDVSRRLGNMPRPSARQECQVLVAEHFRERAPALVGDLNTALSQQEAETYHIFDALEGHVFSATGAFVLESLRLLVEGKLARFSVVLAERAEEAEKSLADAAALLECAGAALSRLAKEGGARPEDAIPHFRSVFGMRLGGPVFLDSFAELVTHHDAGILADFLADPDFKRRFVLLDAIGSKEDEHFAEFFLTAARDSIVDVGQRAVQHLGKLRRGQEIFLDYFKSGDPEKMRLAVWGFREVRLAEAADMLLDFIVEDVDESVGAVGRRNDLLVEVAGALSGLRVAKAVPVFLRLLHDGQPLMLQTALAEALAALELPEASLGLLSKSKGLRHTEVLFTALEGALPPFGSFEQPFPLGSYDDLQKLLDRCCNEREGQGQQFRALCAMERLFVLDVGIYEKLTERLSDYLSHLRAQENWDKAANDRLNAIIKELAKRCERLRQLNQKEADLTNLMQRTAPAGPLRTDALVTLRAKLDDPDLIMKAEMAKALSTYVQTQLKVPGQQWRDQAHLCEIGGMSGRRELVEPIKTIYSRAAGLGLKSAARNALIRLGLTEAELNRRGKISSIVVLEPSAFFRKRLLESLNAGGWVVRDAGTLAEAEKMLGLMTTDLLISEYIAPAAWFKAQWEKGRLQYVYLCTSVRDLSELGEPPWLIGVLNKPFPMEKLLEDLRD